MATDTKIPRWLTTITVFSKTLTFILFIVLPLIAFYLGNSYQKVVNEIDYEPISRVHSIIITPRVPTPTHTPTP